MKYLKLFEEYQDSIYIDENHKIIYSIFYNLFKNKENIPGYINRFENFKEFLVEFGDNYKEFISDNKHLIVSKFGELEDEFYYDMAVTESFDMILKDYFDSGYGEDYDPYSQTETDSEIIDYICYMYNEEYGGSLYKDIFIEIVSNLINLIYMEVKKQYINIVGDVDLANKNIEDFKKELRSDIAYAIVEEIVNIRGLVDL